MIKLTGRNSFSLLFGLNRLSIISRRESGVTLLYAVRLSTNRVFDLSSCLTQFYFGLLGGLARFSHGIVNNNVTVDVSAADYITGVRTGLGLVNSI